MKTQVKEGAIPAATAIKVLPEAESIHTFIRMGAWMGCDMDRDEVIQAINDNGAELSNEAGVLDHYLAVPIMGQTNFIETNPEALRNLGLLTT